MPLAQKYIYKIPKDLRIEKAPWRTKVQEKPLEISAFRFIACL